MAETEIDTFFFTERSELIAARNAVKDFAPAARGLLKFLSFNLESLRWDKGESPIVTITGAESSLVRQALYHRLAQQHSYSRDWGENLERTQAKSMLGLPTAPLENWEVLFGPKNLELTKDTPGFHVVDANPTNGLLEFQPSDIAA